MNSSLEVIRNMKNSPVLIGNGLLNWCPGERITDRYGSVCLFKTIENDEANPLKKTTGKGKLVVRIKETRKSSHVGDWSHSFIPSEPEIDEVIELGNGTIFFDVNYGVEMVGLKPDDNRTFFWLNPEKLYRCHHQTVELYFQEEA